MPFITKSNFSHITKLIEFDNKLSGDVYKRRISFLNKKEEGQLLKIKEILESVNGGISRFYVKAPEFEDSQSFVFEGGMPAYHKLSSCSRLNAEYLNFSIPQQIKDANLVREYREWFKENLRLLDRNDDLLNQRIKLRFGIEIQGKIQRPNSGNTDFDNLTLETLEERIDLILREVQDFYDKSPIWDREIIDTYAVNSYMHNPKWKLWPSNDTIQSDDYIRGLLKSFDIKFKIPIKKLLQQYYMIKYNPELEFRGSLLDQLGFKQCSKCYDANEKLLS